MISLGRLGRSASVVAGGPRYTLLQQPASLIGIRKAVSTSPAAAVTTAAKTVLVPSVPTEASARSFAGVGGNDRLLRPYVVKLATTSGQAAQFSSIRLAATRAFVSCSSDLSRYRPEEQGRLVAAESLPPLPSLLLPKLLHLQRQQRYNWGYQQQRGMMSAGNDGGGGAKGGAGGATGAGQQQKGEDQEEQEPLEEEDHEKLGAKGVLQLIAMVMVLGVAGVCGYFITMELMPSRMSPNTVMNKAHDAFLADPDTANHFGTPLKAYGRDNQRREGRRNFVEHEEYEVKADGSKRTRVKFNVEGPHGHGMAYAEVSNKMSSGEWVYLCVQDLQTGHVITLQDNRAMLAAQSQAESKAEKDAFAAMLGKRS